MGKRLMGTVVVPLGVLLLGAAPALAANLRVAPRQASFGCAQNAQYYTISSAVAAAKPGDQITVCPGTYQEQVTINKPNITLQSQQPLQATIKAPANTSNATIVSITAPGVKVQGFTITVSGQSASCDSVEYGVYISGGGSGDLEQNDISDIGDTPLSGCQNGIAVEAGRASVSTTGSVTLKQNTIEDYQKGGVVVSGVGSSGDLENNTIIGVGPTSTIAQNGIQVSDGATGTIKNNTVSNNIYVGTSAAATGILLCGQGATDIENNVVSTNDVGIYDVFNDQGCTPPSSKSSTKMQNNTVPDSTLDGVVLDGENGGQLQNNQVAGSWGHMAYGADQGDGIDVYLTTGSLIQNNQSAGNSEDGIHNEPNSTGNTYQGNQSPANKVYDCEDDTGTSTVLNTWNNDQGDVNLPQVICKGNPAVAAGGPTATAMALSGRSDVSSSRPEPSPAH